MLALSFFNWWYGPGWAQVVKSLGGRLNGAMEMFSVSQLLKTIFAPWRRIITYPGASLVDKWHAWIDNLFSRVIGFIVRLFVLLAAFVTLFLVAVLTVAEIIAWPLLPLAVPVCLILGLVL